MKLNGWPPLSEISNQDPELWTPADYRTMQEMGTYMPSGCGDDRWKYGGLQFFGGQYGAAIAYGTAMNMKNHSFDYAANGMPHAADELAVITEGALKLEGILGLNHEACAGALGAKTIALTGIELPGMADAERKGALRQRKEALAHVHATSDMSEDRFDEVSAQLAQFAADHMRDPEVAQEAMLPKGDNWLMNSQGLLVPTETGIPRVPLDKPEHEARIILVNDDPTFLFRAMNAWDTNRKAYHVSRGQLPRIHRAIGNFMGRDTVAYQDMLDVVTVFTAKTALNLKSPIEGEPLTIQHIERVLVDS